MKRHAKIIEVTPKLADQWLKKNSNNRPLRPGLVHTYAHTMKSGQWKLTAEPIIFSAPYTDKDSSKRKSETLMDGQHRLAGVIESGCTVPMTVWFGCDASEFSVLGNGRRRTAGDVLSLVHTQLKDPFVIASIGSGFARYILSFNRPVEPWIVREIIEAYPHDTAAGAKYKHRLGRFANQPALAAFVLGRLVKAQLTDELVEQISSGIGFKENDPGRRLWSYMSEQVMRLDGKDGAESVFYKVCNGVAAHLRGDDLTHVMDNMNGLEYLRQMARVRLLDGLKIVYGDHQPMNFFDPKATARRVKLKAKSVA